MSRYIYLMPSAFALSLMSFSAASFASPFTFTAGDLVVSEVGRAASGDANSYTLDQASPLVLQQYSVNGTNSVSDAGQLVLPQTASGNNSAISGEFGSASEALLQLSGNGQYLTVMGYGVNAAAFNANPGLYTGSSSITALGQSLNPTIPTANSVARVVGLIGADGSVDTSTALYGVFNGNNPRSAYTVNGSSFYVSGQGSSKTDPTQGVFYAARGANTATVIDNSTDTRDVQIVNGKLVVSRDYNPPGSGGQKSYVDTLTNAQGVAPTSSSGVTDKVLTPTGSNGKSPPSPAIAVTLGNANGIDNSRIGSFVYQSPEQFFFASASVLYVADSGAPKNGNAGAAGIGDGGLQKWVNSKADGSGTWSLAYTLSTGLGLVNNASSNAGLTANGYGGYDGDVTGLFGLTGLVLANGEVELYATSYTKNELDTSYLFGIDDLLSAITLPVSESFTTLATSSADAAIRGVSFAPTAAAVPEPGPLALLVSGLASLWLARRGRKV